MNLSFFAQRITSLTFGSSEKTNRSRRRHMASVLWIATLASNSVLASGMRIGSVCEAAWGSGYVTPLPPKGTEAQRVLAEQGDAQAQYFMGVATEDREESNAWLRKAAANGSKGAAAYYAYYRDPRLGFFNNPERWREDANGTHVCWWPRTGLSEADQNELLNTIIAAAEAGEPQPATWLWQMVTGGTRLGSTLKNCKISHSLLKASDAPKWAEIAAREGNPWAQEQLCWAYTGATLPHQVRAPDEDWGFQANPAKAFQWCSVVTQNDCSRRSFLHLAELYELGVGVEKSPQLARYWRQRQRAVAISAPVYVSTTTRRSTFVCEK